MLHHYLLGMQHELFFQADNSVCKFEPCEKYYHSFDFPLDYSQDSSTLNVSRDSNETTVTTDEDVDRGDGVSKILYDIPGYTLYSYVLFIFKYYIYITDTAGRRCRSPIAAWPVSAA